MTGDFTHFNEQGRARMVDVTKKDHTVREAVAQGSIILGPVIFEAVREGRIAKGDVLAVAQVAGVTGAKETSRIIPMCHPLMLGAIDLKFRLDVENKKVDIQARVKCTGPTGVEMEALTAVTSAALTIYDMCKALGKEMRIEGIRLVKKSGGKSGEYKEGNSEWV